MGGRIVLTRGGFDQCEAAGSLHDYEQCWEEGRRSKMAFSTIPRPLAPTILPIRLEAGGN